MLELGSGYVSDDAFIWTAEMIIRNDHGSPVAIVWPWVCAGGPQYVSPAAEYWDLSGGTANVVQTMDSSLIPTPAEGGISNTDEVAGNAISAELGGFGVATRSQFASSLYVDPLDEDNEVYLLAVKYAPIPGGAVVGFYRIRADGSSTFEFMDGIRRVWYSIIPWYSFGFGILLPGTSNSVDSWAAYFQHDFVSDPDNVWVPNTADVIHLDRQCEQQWEVLEAFPPNLDPDRSGYDLGYFTNPTSPPPLVTFDDGDWLLGGGYGPQLLTLSADPSYVASLKAKICRCCLPCLKHIGLHIWEKV